MCIRDRYDALMAPCLGLRTVQDANLHVTVVAAALYLGTEGEESWNILNGCTKDLDNYNDPATIDTTDRGPGALASLRKMGGIKHGNFWDTFHIRKNIDDSSNLYKADNALWLGWVLLRVARGRVGVDALLGGLSRPRALRNYFKFI